MHHFNFATLCAIFALVSLVEAVPMPQGLRQRAPETDVNVCRPLAKGKCTLTVTDTLIVVPALSQNPGDNFAGAESSDGKFVFDNNCNPLKATSEVESLGTAKGFGGNINVEGLTGPIAFHADTIGAALGTTGISFKHRGKEFSDCDCQDDSKGLTGKEACRCEFDCPPPPASGIVSGTCSVHVTQNQRPVVGKDPFTLDVRIVDAARAKIGGTSEDKPVDAPTGKEITIDSKLASGFKITAGPDDDDPLSFNVNGKKFDSNSQCSVGAYDSGNRDMDCDFAC